MCKDGLGVSYSRLYGMEIARIESFIYETCATGKS